MKIQTSPRKEESRKGKESEDNRIRRKTKERHLLRESIFDKTVGIVPRNSFPAKCRDPIVRRDKRNDNNKHELRTTV